MRRLVPAGRRIQDLAYSSDYSKLALTHPDGSIDVLSASGQPLSCFLDFTPGGNANQATSPKSNDVAASPTKSQK